MLKNVFRIMYDISQPVKTWQNFRYHSNLTSKSVILLMKTVPNSHLSPVIRFEIYAIIQTKQKYIFNITKLI